MAILIHVISRAKSVHLMGPFVPNSQFGHSSAISVQHLVIQSSLGFRVSICKFKIWFLLCFFGKSLNNFRQNQVAAFLFRFPIRIQNNHKVFFKFFVGTCFLPTRINSSRILAASQTNTRGPPLTWFSLPQIPLPQILANVLASGGFSR